jgi:hypothetical protein
MAQELGSGNGSGGEGSKGESLPRLTEVCVPSLPMSKI